MTQTETLAQRSPAAASLVRVRITTDLGDIVVSLDAARAPNSVAAFLGVLDAGDYNGGSFGRIVRHDNDQGLPTISVIQGACRVGAELNTDLVHEPTGLTGLAHEDGTLSLPRSDGGAGTAHGFFFCIGAQPALDEGGGRTADGLGFAAIGKIVEGLEVARAIHGVPTLPEAPHPFLRGQLAEAPVLIHHMRVEGSDPSRVLADLAADYWDFRVREFPLEASSASVRSANRLLDRSDEADVVRRVRLCEVMLSRARAIETDGLTLEESTTHALLLEQLASIVAAFAVDEHHRPQLFPLGFVAVVDWLAKQTALDTAADRDDFIARLAAVPAYLDSNLARLREGFARGYRIPAVLLPRILSMIDADLAEDGAASVIAARFSPDLPGIDRERLNAQRGEARAIVTDVVLPAIQRVRDYIASQDGEGTTAEIATGSQPGGREYYRYKVRQQTSADADPDEIHAIGLAEVARIHAEVDALLGTIGRAGERAAYATELEARVAGDADMLLGVARSFAKRVDGLLPRLFGTMPRITYGVESFTVAASAALPPALAQPAPADRSMPGIYWLTALPEKLPLHLIPALTLHEAWPGHLMQLAIANELEGIPAFRRHFWTDYNGYVEGWALYCERLGHDLGLYNDPADRFGLLTFELWRAARLVVDTGIHWLGWSRAAAIDYLVQNCFMPRATCESEVDRYIGMPAQALSYKMGERVFAELRADAEKRLGDGFSLRDFHDTILSLGPVSLTQLRIRVEAWIIAELARATSRAG